MNNLTYSSRIPKLLDLNYIPHGLLYSAKLHIYIYKDNTTVQDQTLLAASQILARLVISGDLACCLRVSRWHSVWLLKFKMACDSQLERNTKPIGALLHKTSRKKNENIGPTFHPAQTLKLISISRGTNLTIGGSWLYSQSVLRAWDAESTCPSTPSMCVPCILTVLKIERPIGP